MSAPSPGELDWLADGTQAFEAALDAVDDAGLDAATLLPEWDRRHLLAHVALNADALRHLLDWARTGVENPMYPSAEQRRADIEREAAASAEQLRALARESAASLAADVKALPPECWQARVRTAQGRDVAASAVIWMRVREVWLHAVDLASTVSLRDLPTGLLTALLDDTATRWSTRTPALRLVETDGVRSWRVGAGAQPIDIHGSLPSLVEWCTGRGAGAQLRAETGALPTLGAWL